MPAADAPHIAIASAAAFLAGAINSVAGGGTLISFPTLIWLGLPSIPANATNTLAIWPGSLGSIWGFRRELKETDARFKWLGLATLGGGGVGASLLRLTPGPLFDRLVPFLILFASLLFTVQGSVQARMRKTAATAQPQKSIWMPGAAAVVFLVSIYGGYFGAGMSIMMLSALSVLGMTDILKMSALTSFYGLCTNGVAALIFISAGMIHWPYILPMALAAMLGGYGAAGVARKIGRNAVRRFVTLVGFTISAIMLYRAFR